MFTRKFLLMDVDLKNKDQFYYLVVTYFMMLKYRKQKGN